MTISRYLGVAAESAFGALEANPVFYQDFASCDIGPPDGAEMETPSSLSRFPLTHQPGPYSPKGKINLPAADPNNLYYWLWMALGSRVSSATGVVAIDDESVCTVAHVPTTASITLAHVPVVPGTVKILTTGDDEQAHDNGTGLIVITDAHTITGSVDYITGEVILAGMTTLTAYDVNYSYGLYSHTITPTTAQEMPSMSLYIGQDIKEYQVAGVVITGIDITVDQKEITVSIDTFGGKDGDDTIGSPVYGVTYPLSFFNMSTKAVEYGGVLADVSANIEKLTISIKTGATPGYALNSRFPQRAWAGKFDVDISATMIFEDYSQIEALWGGQAAPTTTPAKEWAYEFTLDGGVYGDTVITIPRTYPNSAKPKLSGRDRISQDIKLKALYDVNTSNLCSIVSQSIYNYDDPA
jgi:hypothetical protein